MRARGKGGQAEVTAAVDGALAEAGWTSQHEAARRGDAVRVAQSGEEPKTCDGWTPLMVAVWGQHLDCATSCLSQGASSKMVSEDGFSVLHLAACRADGPLMDLLHQAGATCSSLEAFSYVRQTLGAVFLRAGDNSFLRHDAEMDDDPDVYGAQNLDAPWPAPVQRWLSRTEAGMLVGSKHLFTAPRPAEVVRGAPPSHGGEGWPCAYSYRLARCLLEGSGSGGGKPHSAPGVPPLSLGLSSRASGLSSPEHGHSLAEALLVEASGRGHVEGVRALLGRQPHLPVGSALSRACGQDHESVVTLLRPLASELERESALTVACRHARLSVVKQLLGEGPPSDRALLAAAGRFGRAAAPVLRLLIKRGASLDCRDENGRTPLMLAKSTEVARVLLGAGAQVSGRDCYGDNAETIASEAGRPGVVRAIREFGEAR